MMFLNRLSFRFSNRLGLAILLALAVAGVGSGLLWGLPLGQANAESPFLDVEDEYSYSAPSFPAGIPAIRQFLPGYSYSAPPGLYPVRIYKYFEPAEVPGIDEYSYSAPSFPAGIPAISFTQFLPGECDSEPAEMSYEYSFPAGIPAVIKYLQCGAAPEWVLPGR